MIDSAMFSAATTTPVGRADVAALSALLSLALIVGAQFNLVVVSLIISSFLLLMYPAVLNVKRAAGNVPIDKRTLLGG